MSAAMREWQRGENITRASPLKKITLNTKEATPARR
tara:strand:- start:704 stop:811 length:108 start_codon:yes stop_codon:yes gene_type:complete